LKISQPVPGYGAGENGGGTAGGIDAGGIKTFPGQGGFFAEETPNREELYNQMKRRQKRKIRERKRQWRLSKDQP